MSPPHAAIASKGPPTASTLLASARELNQQAEGLLGSDPELARQHVDRAEAMARELGANAILAVSLLLRGRLHYAAAQFDDALRTCNEAAGIAARDGDVSVHAKTRAGLGAIWASLGLAEQALPHLETAAELLLDSADEAGLAVVRSLLGGVQVQLGQAESGQRQFEQALAAFAALDLSDRVTETRHNLACLHNHVGQFSEALALSLGNADEANRLNNITLLAHIEATVTEALCGLHRYDEAVVRARAALLKSRPGSRGELDVMLWLGTALDLAGQTDEALAMLRNTLAVSDAAGMPANRALLGALASLCRRTGRAAEAQLYDAIVAEGAQRQQDRMTRLRLKALEMNVELNAARLRFGRVAAERTLLQAQLENAERLLDAANSPDRDRRSPLLPELGARATGFDAQLDGLACGFSLVYQPIVDLETRTVAGFEALLRLHHPTLGAMLPLEFIARLEASGEIASVGHWVLRQACADLAVLQGLTTRSLRLAINVSPREFDRVGFADDVIAAIQHAGLHAQAVELELTEGVAMSIHASVTQQMQQLNLAGIGMAMDDFGAGFSNFASMSEAPLSRIKIDRSMISSIGRGERQAAVLRSMFQTARNLGLPLVAEGIESAHQLVELRALGCEEGQGFMFSRAVPLELARLLVQRTFAC